MTEPVRPSGRRPDELRGSAPEPGRAPYAEGSRLAGSGSPRALAAASVETPAPPRLRGRGWITAECRMPPRSTHERPDSEAAFIAPLAKPGGHGATFGEMEPEAKARIDRRARAFEKLAAACFP